MESIGPSRTQIPRVFISKLPNPRIRRNEQNLMVEVFVIFGPLESRPKPVKGARKKRRKDSPSLIFPGLNRAKGKRVDRRSTKKLTCPAFSSRDRVGEVRARRRQLQPRSQPQTILTRASRRSKVTTGSSTKPTQGILTRKFSATIWMR